MNHLLEVTSFGGRAFHASCGYDLASFIIGDKFYWGTFNIANMHEEPLQVNSIKQITCRLTSSRVFAVTHDNRILLLKEDILFEDQGFQLDHASETIVTMLTGYNYEIVVVGKKRGLKLRPGWKFDDLDMFTY